MLIFQHLWKTGLEQSNISDKWYNKYIFRKVINSIFSFWLRILQIM